MKHPGEIELALFAGGDLGFWQRWRVRSHLRQCEDCRAEAAGLEVSGERLRHLSGEMPDGVNWNRLAQEMTGNIRVGLAAGECVGPVPSHRPRSLAWHATAAFGVALAIVVAAVWMNFPKVHVLSALRSAGFGHGAAVATAPVQSTALSAATIPESVVLEASPASIDLRAHGGTMSILTSREPLTDGHASSVAVSVSMQGSAGVQYVDSDTGQVTIGRVYYAQ